jgi:hypothetical protein
LRSACRTSRRLSFILIPLPILINTRTGYTTWNDERTEREGRKREE